MPKEKLITKCPKCGAIYGVIRSKVIKLNSSREDIEVKCYGVRGKRCQQKFLLNTRTGKITLREKKK